MILCFVFWAQFFQEDLEKQQQQVNSLTHMVVVVDDSSNESATADLEEQLAVLGERWSNVCKWTEQRCVKCCATYSPYVPFLPKKFKIKQENNST